jgi:centromeric protein E
MLGLCVSQLSKARGRRFLPFRNSKLTRLLQPSLGGNSRTAIIATIHPGPSHIDSSLHTLRFATRAMKVQNSYGINESATAALRTKRLQQDMDSLIAPVLKQRIASLEREQGTLQDKVPPLRLL